MICTRKWLEGQNDAMTELAQRAIGAFQAQLSLPDDHQPAMPPMPPVEVVPATEYPSGAGLLLYP